MKPSKPRRCGCGRPATHRLKGGVNTMFKRWTPEGPSQGPSLRIPVTKPAVCRPCAWHWHRFYGGRIYRWRTVATAGRS